MNIPQDGAESHIFIDHPLPDQTIWQIYFLKKEK